MTQLRQATTSDAEEVARILFASRLAYLPYAPSAHTPEGVLRWVRKTLVPSGGVAIARLDDLDVGVLATSIADDTGWVDQLYIAPGHTGTGIGAELLTHALRILPRPVHLWTFQASLRARRFYENHGFKAVTFTDGQNNEEKCPDVRYVLE